MLTIEPHMDHVLICGQFIKRPAGIARSLWMRFWEEIRSLSQTKKYRP